MKFIAFGESLFRSVTQKGERLADAQTLGFYLGGTELNVAANLAALDVPCAWVSTLPRGLTGELIRDKVGHFGIDASFCKVSSSARVGWYLMESGAAPRPDIVYHRNASAMADETTFTFEWKKILSGATVAHTSGITCGISKTLTAEVHALARACRESGVRFSYDVNFRANIWTIDESVKRQKEIVPAADILFCANTDLKLFYGDDFETDHFAKVFNSSRTQTLVMSQRSADGRDYGIDIITREKRYSSPRYPVSQIDRVGMGDAAAAGFFSVVLASEKPDYTEAANWAAMMGALKSGVLGDMLLMKKNEIERVLANPQSGIIR